MSALPKKVTDLAEAVRAAGGRAMLNGGWVRDKLLSPPRESQDWDLGVFGVEPDRLVESSVVFNEVRPSAGVCGL
jgi:tRNA nucleotidyltransferase (CCA-adding enzyme)